MASVRTNDDVTLHYRVVGTGPRELVFVHGFAQSGFLFEELIACLDLTGLRCVMIDLRGHGDSDKTTKGYTRDRIAEDIWTVLDHARVGDFVVVGFSAGARTAQYLTCQRPERVQAQVLLGGTPAGAVPLPQATIDSLVSCQGHPAKMEAMRKTYLKAPISSRAMRSLTDQGVRPPRAALEGFLRVMTTEPFEERLASVEAPTLIVHGADDALFAPDVIKHRVAAAIPRARTVFLPDTGHYLPVERPEETARLIEAFLAGLTPAAQNA